MSVSAVLHFDELAHRYSVDGQELLGVTHTLDEAGLVDDFGWTDATRERGAYVHAAIVLHHQGDLDIEALDGVLLPYVGAYLGFLDDSGFRVVGFEERVFSLALRCAGTLDLRGSFPDDPPFVTNIVDIKSGTVPMHVGYQVAAYALLLPRDPQRPIVRRYALNLRSDGSYRLEPLTKASDETVFRAALTVVQARRGWV